MRDRWSTPGSNRPEPVWPVTACQHRWPSDPCDSRPGQLDDIAGYRSRVRVARECCWTLWALGPEGKSPGRAGQHPGPSEPSASCPGELGNPAGTGTRPQVGQDIWSRPQDLRHEPESPGRAGRQCGPSTGARVARECGWIARALGEECESPRRAGRIRGTLDRGPSRPGVLVDPACYRSRVRVSRDSWSTPRALGVRREWSGTSSRTSGPTTLARVPK